MKNPKGKQSYQRKKKRASRHHSVRNLGQIEYEEHQERFIRKDENGFKHYRDINDSEE